MTCPLTSSNSGQDQMRIVKQRLLELVPDLHVFLDVDGAALSPSPRLPPLHPRR